ncbi:fumarylacetoacetate hydrolase family protein [Blastococcus brunescens]|uniref:Fumarylacetoacetate hydrolase family protein n=1 Tax=Blastococcus brunescens TaxID=1564165 RepID=A0ABZ1AYQ2_9ACTN|nr:fumarylacetoacetate hydrolase family protein [Blastococcus sp. BMG 8361]WRL63599.1 fumarylacetoacetate hydrolase family protein [Blastococcus sp. BMG 8361]
MIGRRCSGLSEAASLDAVFGYTLIDDVSNRALQREREQWFLGKAADGHAPAVRASSPPTRSATHRTSRSPLA